MTTMSLTRFGIVGVVTLSLGFGLAPGLSSVGEAKTPAEGANLTLKEKFERIKAQRRKPEVSQSLGRTSSGESSVVFECVLESTGEGGILVSRPVDPEALPGLLASGHRVVTKRDDVGDGTIFENRVFIGYRLAPPRPDDCTACAADELFGPTPEVLKRHLGKPVRVVLETNQRRRYLVTDVRSELAGP
ncbi:MAG: hypothetical protein H6729_11625 [Deltaproteobacteria bacterium]|nr:hypothetical protein [Deltaproteobacteria bacterium]